MKKIQFVEQYQRYGVGEIVELRDSLADIHLAKQRAVEVGMPEETVTPKQQPRPAETKQVTQPQQTKQVTNSANKTARNR